jgi:hypothetical protein
LGMTLGSPPSITATTEFVVPRSIPIILPITGSSQTCKYLKINTVTVPLCYYNGYIIELESFIVNL